MKRVIAESVDQRPPDIPNRQRLRATYGAPARRRRSERPLACVPVPLLPEGRVEVQDVDVVEDAGVVACDASGSQRGEQRAAASRRRRRRFNQTRIRSSAIPGERRRSGVNGQRAIPFRGAVRISSDQPSPPSNASATPFEAAARRLLGGFSGGESSASGEDLDLVTTVLARSVRGVGVRSREDAEEIAHEAVFRASRAKRDHVSHAGAYLLAIAKHLAIDQWRKDVRRAGKEVLTGDIAEFATAHYGDTFETSEGGPLGYYSAQDDAVAQLLEQTITARAVEHALRAANSADDVVTVRVVSTWLELAETTRRPPSSREVARRAGVSHTSVNRALQRFRRYVASGRAS